MEKLQTQEVYIPVDVNERNPNANAYRICLPDKVESFFTGTYWENLDYNPTIVTHWLEKSTDKYPLTKEQIIKLVGDAFEAGSQFYEELVDSANYGDKINAPDQETYIDNLFK